MGRKSTLGWVRRGKRRGRESGYIVTWDVDSQDRSAANRLQYFLFGRSTTELGWRRYGGFLEKEGVRYMGQSVIFVLPPRLNEIDSFLEKLGIGHEITGATVG